VPVLGEIHAEPILPKKLVFDTMGYEVHPPPADVEWDSALAVKDFHDSEARRRIVTAPARSGKSFSAAPEIVFRAQPHKPLLSSLQWLVGIDYPTNKEFQYVWEALVENHERWAVGGQQMMIEKAHNNPTNGNMLIVIDWGKGPHGRAKAVIEGKSATNPRALQGEHVTQWLQSEAAEHEEEIWNKYGRTRSTWAIFPTTPKPKAQWLRKMSEDGRKDAALSIETFLFPFWANPLYDREQYEFEKRRAEMNTDSGNAEDDQFFAEQFLGRWVHYTGRVLPFGEANLVTVDPAWLDVSKIFVSVDYGYEDACVALFWAVLPSGALLIFDEVYSRHLTSFEFVEQIEEKLKGRVADYVCGDPKKPEVARYMQDFGMNVIDVDKGAQVDRSVGKRRLVDLCSINPDTKYPGLFVSRENCPKTIVEWETLVYKDGFRDEDASNALSGADHAFDAARYGVMTRPAPAREAEPPSWLHEVERERRRMHSAAGLHTGGSSTLARWAASKRSPYARRRVA